MLYDSPEGGRLKTRLHLPLAILAAAAALLGAAGASGRTSDSSIRKGGVFRVALQSGAVDFVDPALSYSVWSWILVDTTCARLMSYPDKAPPEGFRLQPEVAARYPRVTNDARTFTFTLRRGFRFSNGQRVTASAFARAMNRTLAPGIESPGAQYTQDVVGSDAVLAGSTQSAAGIVARGNRLVVRLKHPTPDFPARTTMPFFCAVPPTLPTDPEGLDTSPAAGPYYVAEYLPGASILLKRNRFYRGRRPHHVDSFVVDLRSATSEEVLDRIEQGRADWGNTGLVEAPRLAAKYGINRSRFFLKTGLTSRGLAFNTSRGVFHNNPRLRRAVNFAVDRSALRRAIGGPLTASLTDQYLPPGIPGYRDAHIYPLPRPDPRKARALARGHTRGGKVMLYVQNVPVRVVQAQILTENLRKIGLDVETKAIPPRAFIELVLSGDEPWDIAAGSWSPDYVDPYAYLNVLFDGRFIGSLNLSRFDSGRYNGLLRRAARIRGSRRYQAYGKLDVRLARDVAPMIPTVFTKEPTFVSKRVDRRCIVLRPALDLAAVCLKR
jgi:peptide/nickel transport system substrate-binding protein